MLVFIIKNGTLIGLICGGIFCGLIALLAVYLSNKENKEIDKALKSLSSEEIKKVKSQTFEKGKKKDLFSSNGMIANLEEKGNKVNAILLFYNEPHDQFYSYEVKFTKKQAKEMGIKNGKLIPALMTYDKSADAYLYKQLA